MLKPVRRPKQAASLRSTERKPTHPGAILREDVLPALRTTQTEHFRHSRLEQKYLRFCQRLCVTPQMDAKPNLPPAPKNS